MSKTQSIQAPCPRCGKQISTDAWTSINSETDTQARQEILDGTLFDVQCPHCQNTIHMVYPVMYNDVKNSAVVWLVTNANDMAKAATVVRNTRKLKSSSDNMRWRIVNEPNDFREKAIIFSNGLDDRVTEIAKITYLNTVRTKHPEEDIAKVYFAVDKNTGGWRFEMYASSGKVFTAGLTKELYDKIERLYTSKKDKLPDDEELYIDRTWALSVYGILSAK